MRQNNGMYQIIRKNTDGSNEKPIFQIDASNGTIVVGDTDIGTGRIRLHETGASENSITLDTPALTSDVTLTLPNSVASDSNQILADTDGAGTLGWVHQVQWLHFGYTYDIASTTNIELRTVNGSDNGHGYKLPRAATLKRISVQLDCNAISGGPFTATVTVFKNSTTDSGQTCVISGIGATGDFGNVTTGLNYSFAQSDTIHVKAKVSNVNITVTNLAVILDLAI